MLTRDTAEKTVVGTAAASDAHEESSVPAIVWLVPLLAAIIVPGLLLTAPGPFAFRVDLFATMTALSATVAAGIMASLSRGFRSRIRWSLGVTTVVMITLFMWPALALAGRIIARRVSIPLLTDVVPVALAVGLLWLAVRLAGDWQFVAITGPIVLITAGVLAATAAPLVASKPTAVATAKAVAGSPDVLLLVLDAYGRADVLEDVYGFDSTEFLAGLEDRGFAIATDATANYTFTFAALASMLDLDYVFDEGEVVADEVEVMRTALSGNADMTTRFKEAGYEIAYLENAWAGSYCGGRIDWCIRDGLLERGLWSLGQQTIAARLLQAARPHPFNSVSMAHLESLPDILNRPHSDGRPRFTFAHIILPHQPLVLDAECRRHNTALRRSLQVPSEADLAQQRQHHAGQTACTNDTVLDALDGIIEAHPDMIVMLTGDHGPTLLSHQPPEFWPDEAMRERMTILSAYRLPGCSELFRPDITPVNGARAVTNCALGTSLQDLADVNYWMPLGAKGTVVDLTDRLDE